MSASNTDLFARSKTASRLLHIFPLQSIEYAVQTLNVCFQFVGQRSGRHQNISPDMKRTCGQTGDGFPARSGKFTMFAGVFGQDGGKNLRKMAELGDQPVVVFGADDMGKGADSPNDILQLWTRPEASRKPGKGKIGSP